MFRHILLKYSFFANYDYDTAFSYAKGKPVKNWSWFCFENLKWEREKKWKLLS